MLFFSLRGREVEELCKGSLEAVSSLYPALRNLQSLRELESIKPLFSRYYQNIRASVQTVKNSILISPPALPPLFIRSFSELTVKNVHNQRKQHSQLLSNSDFALVEPILAIRSVSYNTLMSRTVDPDTTQCLSSVLTDHLLELCQMARKAGNTQVVSAETLTI